MIGSRLSNRAIERALWALVLVAVLAMLAVLTGCAASPATSPGPEPGSRTITLTAAQVEQCHRDGGCAYLSQRKAQEFIEYGYQFGPTEAAQTCRRGSRM